MAGNERARGVSVKRGKLLLFLETLPKNALDRELQKGGRCSTKCMITTANIGGSQNRQVAAIPGMPRVAKKVRKPCWSKGETVGEKSCALN